jgi:hypothetical protein
MNGGLAEQRCMGGQAEMHGGARQRCMGGPGRDALGGNCAKLAGELTSQ